VTLAWTRLSGPGTASFTAPTQAVTNVSFSVAGDYTLQLSAFDGELTSTHTVAVHHAATAATLNRAILKDDDDAEQRGTLVDRVGSSLELVMSGTVNQVVGLRFIGVTIPHGAIVTSAQLQFTAKRSTSSATQLVIAGEASDDAAEFSSAANDISSRTRTTATVAWAPAPWTTVDQAGPNQRTPDLASIVQEIVSRPGWVSVHAMVFVITGTSGTRAAYSHDGSHSRAPRLVVSYHM
jgi:hypothetical protein